jgi:succinate dehydrogenase/fumarate reductase flavoprotein subunit
VPGTLDTKGGPRIDTNSRLLRSDGSFVPGLYGAGNCIASPAGQAYWAGGTTLGLAATFGWIAGNHAANRHENG